MRQPNEIAAYRKGRAGAWLGIVGNVLLSLVKFLAGILGHSAAMVADGVHSLSDILSSVIVLIGLKVARQKPDARHPYGHSKAESIAAQVVALFLTFLGGMIFYNSFRSISLSDYREPSLGVLIVALVSIVVKEGLYRYKVRLGRKIGSSSLVADAWHHRSDAFSSIAVLVGVFLARVGGPRLHIADHIAAMIVALMICYTGLRLLFKTSSELMDQVVIGPAADDIRKLIVEVDGVKAVEKLFVRKAGMELIIDIHIEVEPDLSVVRGHNIAETVKAMLRDEFEAVRNVMVHVEPHGNPPGG